MIFSPEFSALRQNGYPDEERTLLVCIDISLTGQADRQKELLEEVGEKGGIEV